MKKIIIITLFLAAFGYGQTTALLSPVPRQQFSDVNGNPLAAGKLFSYQAGTTTPQNTFTDSTGGTPNANPLILDSGGFGGVWLGSTNCYKLVLQNAQGVVQWTIDNICSPNLSAVTTITSAATNPASAGFIRMANGDNLCWRNIANTANICFIQQGAAAAGTGNIADVLLYGDSSHGGLQAQTFLDTSAAPAQSGVLRCGNNVPCVVQRNAAGNGDITAIKVDGSNITNIGGTAGAAMTGPLSIAGTFSGATQINKIVYADQYASVNAAISACQSIAAQSPTSGGTVGCTIYATSNLVNLALGTIDPGANTIPITLILGPFDFTAVQITMRSDLKIIGAGYYTTITSVGTNAQNLIIFPQVNTIAVTHTLLKDMRIFGLAGNTSQEGLSPDVSGLTTSQWSHSSVEHVEFHNFKGAAIHLKGRPSDANSAIQFIYFVDVWANRPSGGTHEALRIEGYNAQLSFETCEFDGFSNGDGQDDIYLGSSGTFAPLTIFFHNTTFQNGSVGFHFNSVQDVTVDGGHTEQTPTVFSITYNGSMGSASNNAINITHTYIAGTSAATAVITDTDGFSNGNFVDNLVFGAPGAFINGANAANMSYCGNRGATIAAGCNVTSPLFVTGVSQGSGFKHQRFGASCTTAAAVGAVCNSTYTWATTFADASYTISCTGDNSGGGALGVPIVNNVSRAAGTVLVSVAALTAVAAQFPAVDCIAVHDGP